MVCKSLGLVGLPALLEAEAIPVHLQDMDMVGEAVEEGPGEAFRAEDLGPLVEGQVGGSQDRAAFIALAEDLEEQLGPGLGQGTKPSSSMIRSLRRASSLCKLSNRRLSSLASINSWTSAAAVVNPTDSPL